MTTRSQLNREIAEYVLGVLKIHEDTVHIIIDELKYNTVSKLRKRSTEQILHAAGEQKIAISDTDQLLSFQKWIQKQHETGEPSPGTLDEW
jgi:hypothetical protein